MTNIKKMITILILYLFSSSHGFIHRNFGKFLPKNVITEIYSVSLVACAKDCSSRKSCLSVNYQQRYQRCILNDAVITSGRIVKETDRDMAYLDIDDWPETLKDCDGSMCSDRERCTVDKSAGRTTCIPSECPDVSRPDHGFILEYGRSVGDIVTYECETGYERDVNAPSVCLTNGRWSNLPLCYRTLCPLVPTIPRAVANTTDSTAGTVVGYTCSSGYIGYGGDDTITCDHNGQWSINDFQCFYDCGAPDVILNTDMVTNHTHATYTCSSGYTSVNGQPDDIVECSENLPGWTSTRLECIAVCPQVPTIQKAVANTTDRTAGTVVGYNCTSGYIAYGGDDTITCDHNGQWSINDFQCFYDCGSPDVIHKADMVANYTHATYTCSSGYTSVNGQPDDIVECSENLPGWTSTRLECVADPCESGYSLIYEVDVTGDVLVGNFSDLREKVMSGMIIRVMISDSKTENHHIIEASSVTLTENEVIVTSVHNDEKIFTNANILEVNRLYYAVNSSGLVSESRWKIGTPSMISQNTYQSHMSWFADMESFQSIYIYDPNTATASGSMMDLVDKAAQGSEIQVMTDSKLLYKPGSIEYSTSGITIQNDWYLGNLISFTSNLILHWSLSLLDPSTGSISKITWYTESNANFLSNGFAFQDWICNDCWELIYENDDLGNTVYGNLSQLLDMIRDGHRVRIDTDGKFEEASSIRIVGGDVWVQTLDSAVQDGNANFDATNLRRIFRSMSTSGAIFASHCGDGECTAQAISNSRSMKWYVDKVTWKMLWVNARNQIGQISSPSSDLFDKIKEGRKVRLHIHDYWDLDIYMNADHVTIDDRSGTIEAASVKHLYMETGVSLQVLPDWQFFYVTTASINATIVRMKYFEYKQTLDQELEVKTEWFVH